MDTQLLPYRIKTARRKKRLVIEGRDKELLRLDRRQDELYFAKRNLPIVPLDKPYQKGWKRLFVLKPKMRESEKAQFFQGILDKINTVQYHYDESFKQTKRGKRWHRYNSARDVQLLRPISWYEWQLNKLELTNEEKLCFELVSYYNEYHAQWSHTYQFMMPWLFELKVKPHMITEAKLSDELLEQELGYLDKLLGRGGFAYRLSKLRGGSYNYWKRKYWELGKYENSLKNIPVYLVDERD